MGLNEIGADVYKEILTKKLKRNDFEFIEGKLDYSDEVKGFHGEHGILTIQCKVENRLETFKFFFKGILQRTELFNKYFSQVNVFEREHYLQSVVIKRLESVTGRKFTAECYYSRLNKFLVCEDLTELKFERMRQEYADTAHAELALKAQAAFHAASFVLEEKTGKPILKNFPEMQFDTVFSPIKDEKHNRFSKTLRTLLSHIISKESFNVEESCRETFLDWYDFVISSAVTPDRKKRNAVLHGDTMAFNYLYRYNLEGKPLETILIDFQFSRISPPAVDVISLMATQMTLEQETILFESLTQFYYLTLRRYLTDYKLDPDQVMTEKEFKESLADLKPFRACVRLVYSLFIHVPPERLYKTLSCPESIYQFLGVGDTDLIDECLSECEKFRSTISVAFNEVYKFFKLSNYLK